MKIKYLSAITSILTWVLMHEALAVEEARNFKIFSRDFQNSTLAQQDISIPSQSNEQLTIPPKPSRINVESKGQDDGTELIKKGKNLNEIRSDKLKHIKKEDFVFDINTKMITGYYDNNKELHSVIGEDNRRIVKYPKTIRHPWSTMCHIEAIFDGVGTGYGSGVLIDNQFVLTAGHVVCSRELGGWAIDIKVSPALDVSSRPNHLPYGRYNSYQGKTVDLWSDYQDSDWDFAVLKLDREVTDSYGNSPGTLGVAALSENALERQWVNVTDYPGDKGIEDPQFPIIARDWGLTMWTAGGTITDVNPENLEFEIDINHGNSGGPIWGEWQGKYHDSA
jgi:V8-like Glu-specific endopeptidase